MKHGRKKKKPVFYLQTAAFILLLLILIYGILTVIRLKKKENNITVSVRTSTAVTEQTTTSYTTTTEPVEELFTEQTEDSVYPDRTDKSQRLSKDYKAEHALLMNADTQEVITYRNANARMYPASLTKIMTLIVAVENIEDLSDTVTITDDMVFPMIELEAARAGFMRTKHLRLKMYYME